MYYCYKMSLTPFSRDDMRRLKLKNDEEITIKKIDNIVTNIYKGAIKFAETNTVTEYKFNIVNYNAKVILPSYIPNPIPTHQDICNITKDDIINNITKIILNLEHLFPNCSVNYKKVTMVMGLDGKEYDISTLDDKMIPFINTRKQTTYEYIIIDWS
jgi:hypothetical protein